LGLGLFSGFFLRTIHSLQLIFCLKMGAVFFETSPSCFPCWEFCKCYGLQLFAIGALSVLTVYRREIFCNNIYHHDRQPRTLKDHRSSNRSSSTSSSRIPDKWLLLEHCCYGLAFGPLLSLASFVCRIFLLSLSSLYKAKCEKSFSLRHALAHEWSRCRSKGFHCHSIAATTTTTNVKEEQDQQQLLLELPRDLQFIILTFLPVNDVLVYGRASKVSHSLVHRGTIAYPLWNMLTVRDFHDLIHWDVAQQRYYECTARATTQQLSPPAAEKIPTTSSNPILSFLDNWHTQWADSSSSSTNVGVDKNSIHQQFLPGRRLRVYDLYFTLYVTAIPWSLALRNTTQSCFVGLYNAVYGITAFLSQHPGSVETLLIHAGSDASRTFEAVGHSTRARTLADTMCVWRMKPLNGSSKNNSAQMKFSITEQITQWRRERQQHNNFSSSQQHLAEYDNEDDDSSRLALSIVQQITQRLTEGENIVRVIAEKSLHLEIIVGGTLHLFYDPFICSWCCWYTSLTTDGELEPVMMYVHNV